MLWQMGIVKVVPHSPGPLALLSRAQECRNPCFEPPLVLCLVVSMCHYVPSFAVCADTDATQRRGLVTLSSSNWKICGFASTKTMKHEKHLVTSWSDIELTDKNGNHA